MTNKMFQNILVTESIRKWVTMLKVFLVEDESVIREMLRDKIPWEEYGYEFVGEASDGEMALPLIRRTKPHVLITDIKMPFLDGLSLSKIVSSELPKTKIVIISGYDDFEYARTALELGVAQYLLKPITRMALRKTLLELKEKIEQENKGKDYQIQYQDEMLEYEQFSRRSFFEKMFRLDVSVSELYEEATRLSMDITADAYNLIFFQIEPNLKATSGVAEEHYMLKQNEILHYILRHPQYILFRWNVNCFGVFVKTDLSYMKEATQNCIDKIIQVCKEEPDIHYYIAQGEPVERLSLMNIVYQNVNRYMSYRFLIPDMHLLNKDSLAGHLQGGNDQEMGYVDPARIDPEIIKDFLKFGNNKEIHEFVESYLGHLRNALNSEMFRTYMILSIRFTSLAFLETLGNVTESDKTKITEINPDVNMKPEQVEDYFVEILKRALEIRNRESDFQSKYILRKAQEYIEGNFEKENLSLNEVAIAVGVSANYLSAIFSQGMNRTFIEYVTDKRMEKAKKLLRETEASSGDISALVGYKDPHYFSFVFKKTQGISPREYRNRKKGL